MSRAGFLAAAAAVLLGTAPLHAQPALPAGADTARADTALAGSSAAPRRPRVLSAASGEDDRWRTAQLLGAAPLEGFMIRSLSGTVLREGPGASVVGPEARMVYNSRIPFSLNDGALWAGRGASARVRAGFAARTGPLLVVLAPEVVVSQNREFDALLPEAWDSAQRSTFAPPWQTGRNAVDLPFRQGGGRVQRVEPGQSTVALVGGKVAGGASTESQWWGPGVRNALVLSDNAGGVPHLFLATASPVRTPLGLLEGRWMVGGLSPSAWDTTAGGGRRSLSAAVLALHPGAGFTVGAARAVYAPVDGWGDVAGHAADVLIRRGATGDTTRTAEAEQVMSLFARYVVPGEGLEVYAEWGRHQLPGSLRDLLETPHHTQGYTVGAGWAGRAGSGALALRTEFTFLEQSSTYRLGPIGSWYASRDIAQGYTQRGQLLGAAIGPGASSQYLGADWLGRRARAGLFLGRVRWADDAYVDTPESDVRRYRGHDVSVFGGARAGVVLGGFEWTGEWTVGKRYNYLFQNFSTGWNDRHLAVNVTNHTLGFEIRPVRRTPGSR
ncbi:MAG TPA: capsule assembly Wzi family protein [Longimicrobium sp.]|nr:capsule assembly Wzi family protein [Longimicrobium sp.]